MSWAHRARNGLRARRRATAVVADRSTRSLDLTEKTMSWRPRFHHLKHPKRRPRMKQPRDYFRVSRWPTFSKIFLNLAIRKLSVEEYLAKGPSRTRYRAKRLRAVALYRDKFGEPGWLKDYSRRITPMEKR